ncbi:hypothetical protein D3C74_456740 [compost metagenome]
MPGNIGEALLDHVQTVFHYHPGQTFRELQLSYCVYAGRVFKMLHFSLNGFPEIQL